MEKITSIMELIRWVAVQEHVSELMVQPGAVVRYLKRYFGIHAEGKLPPALWQQCLRENMSLNDLLRQVFPLLEADEIDRILRKEEKDTVLDVYGIDFSVSIR
ncbi:MAG TPA: hypothetical protein PLK12_18040 [Prolixibacteraceae bacterium]|nr:hypothetical protein [Prolixibacteraceae bacterium]